MSIDRRASRSSLNSPGHTPIRVLGASRGIGYGGPGPRPDFDPRSLTSEEITQIGHALNERPWSFSGYQAAIVGWDPEPLVDLDDLEADWRADDQPDYNRLVLADDLCKRWELGSGWDTFEPGHRWLPYLGSKKPLVAPIRSTAGVLPGETQHGRVAFLNRYEVLRAAVEMVRQPTLS